MSDPHYFHHRPKLTPAQREEIKDRAAAGESPLALALQFGVTAQTVRKLRRT